MVLFNHRAKQRGRDKTADISFEIYLSTSTIYGPHRFVSIARTFKNRSSGVREGRGGFNESA